MSNRTVSEMTSKNATWMRTHWRPMMAFVYMGVILFDFIFGPIFWSIIQVYAGATGSVVIQWSPLTLVSGGIFHAAMGAVLGVAAWSRGKEKLEFMKQGGSGNDM